MAFYFKNTSTYIIMIEEDEAEYTNNNICRFREKEL